METIFGKCYLANPPKEGDDPYHDRREAYRANQRQLFSKLREEIYIMCTSTLLRRTRQSITKEKIMPLWNQLDSWQKQHFLKVFKREIDNNMIQYSASEAYKIYDILANSH